MIKKIILLIFLLILLVGRFNFSPYHWQLTINPSYGTDCYGLNGLRYESHTQYKGFHILVWYDGFKNEEIGKGIMSILIDFGTLSENFNIYQEDN